MKVVILCGGRGTRLREETEFRPKPMVMVGNQPILWHIMKLYSYHGFNDFVLCLGYKGGGVVFFFFFGGGGFLKIIKKKILKFVEFASFFFFLKPVPGESNFPIR